MQSSYLFVDIQMAVKLVVVALVEVPPAEAALVVVGVLLIAREVVMPPQMEVGMGEPPKREVCINGKQYKLIVTVSDKTRHMGSARY